MIARTSTKYTSPASAKSSEYLEGRLEDVHEIVVIDDLNIHHYESLVQDAQTQEEADEYRQYLEQRQSARKISKARRSRLEVRAAAANRNIPYMEGLSRGNFQKILADAGLLKLDHEYIDEEDEKHEEQEVSAQGQSEDGKIELYPDEVEYVASEVSIEELHRKTLSEEVLKRHRELLKAYQAFESRHEEYANLRIRHRDMIIEGNSPWTPTELDLSYFEHTRYLTRRLAFWEDAYDEALARRRKLGPADWDQSSGFIIPDEYDGYPLSYEDDMIQTAPLGRIRKWLADMVVVDEVRDIMDLAQGAGNEFGPQEPKDPEEVEGCDVRSAGISDTWSWHDTTEYRKRIDRWRSITGRDR
ncbi:MAG: hypothetical protein LQ350_001939 [Teloschistes chrysophthalmus]|nr:MAG: hypothetical protein LQ350_001939 [Niorma chrysophthalma]